MREFRDLLNQGVTELQRVGLLLQRFEQLALDELLDRDRDVRDVDRRRRRTEQWERDLGTDRRREIEQPARVATEPVESRRECALDRRREVVRVVRGVAAGHRTHELDREERIAAAPAYRSS